MSRSLELSLIVYLVVVYFGPKAANIAAGVAGNKVN